MAVPRNRTSNARKNSRRSHMALKPRQLAECKSCGQAHLSHTMCSACGSYNGQIIVAKKD